MTRSQILLTNDDGIDSPGLKAAVEAALPLGELTVIAPLRQQTSMGRAHCGSPEAMLVPVAYEVNGTPIRAYSCEASPAGVVAHGLRVLTGYTPDLLIAGINYGENVGFNATGSGTVGACLEAACRGIPALAMSLETSIASHRCYTEENWDASTHFTRFFARRILKNGLPADVHILKVEVPSRATADTPWKLTRLTPGEYYEGTIPNPGPHSMRKDVVLTKRDCRPDDTDTDGRAVLVEKVVAVTPLSVDFCSRIALPDLRSWLER